MIIIQQPDVLSPLGNLRHLIVNAADTGEVTMQVYIHGEPNPLVTHVYSPDSNDRIDINLRDVVGAQLSFLLRDATEPYRQQNIVRSFDVSLQGGMQVETVEFAVVRAGIDALADTPQNFFRENFLTWQPTVKPVTYYTPEFLTYYAQDACVVKCTTYDSQDRTTTVTLATISSGECWTIPVGYSVIAGKVSELPSYYDVWVETGSTRLTYIQRYYASNIKSEEEEWILFENSLGGIDTFRAYGDSELHASHEHKLASVDDVSSEYRVDTERKYKKSTGYLDKYERRWLLDFFPSLGKYICAYGSIRRIVVMDDDASYSCKDLPSEYSFTYKFAETKPYLNLPRVDTRLQEMVIKVPDVGSFTIAPRLAEFPRLQLSGGALFPVQNPYSEEWGATSLTTLAQYLSEEILYLAELFGNSHFLSRLHDDVANGHITFLQGLKTLGVLTFGSYVKGLRGGQITADAVAELGELWVRAIATIGDGTKHLDQEGRVVPALAVKGDSTFTGDLSSPEFVSAFFGGNGWAIRKTEYVNAAGVTEYKYHLEIDDVTIRNTLRVYEMIVSQLMGENANRYFSDMMEVDHYEPNTGKVWLKTGDGRLYNSLRVGDIVEVQQYNGDPTMENNWYVTKAYEFRVKAVGIGDLSLGEDRLDWMEFENFTTTMEGLTPETAFREKDTLVRADSVTDPNRKGLVSIMAVGENTPYLDIIYGMKTDPANALKGRIGNLQGIRTDDFGFLKGFGIYTNNFYGTGELHDSQTGERYTARISATKSMMKSIYKETVFDISEDDNIIANGFFENGMTKWSPTNLDGSVPEAQGMADIMGSENVPIMINGQLVTMRNVEQAVVIEYDSLPMLKLNAMGVAQSFADMGEITTHKELTSSEASTTHDVSDTLYMGIRILPLTAGELNVLFVKTGGGTTGFSRQLDNSLEWMLVQAQDSELSPWDFSGNGQLVISYSGECLIRFVALTTDPVAGAKVDYMTRITQTARIIKAEADAVYSTRTMHSELSLEVGRISTEVTNNKSASDLALATLSGRIGSVETWENNTSTWITQTSSTINLWASQFDANGNITRFSGIEQDIAGIRNTVTNNYNASEAAFAALRARATALETWENSTATWIYNTDSTINLWASQFDANGNITRFSSIEQDIYRVQTSVTTNKVLSDKIFAELFNCSQYADMEAQAEAHGNSWINTATWVTNNSSKWAAIAMSFDSDGNVLANGRVALYVKDRTSFFDVYADEIRFTFTKDVNFYAYDGSLVQVMKIYPNGNLWIKGEFKGGSITGDTAIGSGTNRLRILPNNAGGAELAGFNVNGNTETQVLRLGFTSSGSRTWSRLWMKQLGSALSEVSMTPRSVTFTDVNSGVNIESGVTVLTNGSQRALLRSNSWPTESDKNSGYVLSGMVYKDNNGNLKVA